MATKAAPPTTQLVTTAQRRVDKTTRGCPEDSDYEPTQSDKEHSSEEEDENTQPPQTQAADETICINMRNLTTQDKTHKPPKPEQIPAPSWGRERQEATTRARPPTPDKGGHSPQGPEDVTLEAADEDL